MRISIIVAVAENGVIGREGRLPWHLGEDLRRFRQLTMERTIIMGRRTWESISRPLPGRRMIVVSRQPRYAIDHASVQTATSLAAALAIAAAAGEEEAFVMGGAELYREALPRADRLYITRVRANVEGDTYLPTLDMREWQLISIERHPANEKNQYPFDFECYRRA